jgi:hypothetical protein
VTARLSAIAGSVACVLFVAAARPAGDGPTTADPTVLGLRYDINLTVTNAMTQGGQPTSSYTSGVARVQMVNGKVRIEVASGEFAAILGEGDFMTMADSGHVALIFKPSTQQYFQVDLPKLSAGLTHVVNMFGSAIGVQPTNVKIDVTSLGAGDKVGPFSTVKYRLTEDYTLAVAMLGMNMGASTAMHTTTDYLFAPDLTGIVVNPFAQTVQETAWLGADYGKKLSAAEVKLHSGVPVKKVTTEVSTDSTGAHNTTITTWELTGFTRVNVPDSTFRIPAGYTQMQPPASMTQTLSGTNSATPWAGLQALGAASNGTPTGTNSTPAGTNATSAGTVAGTPANSSNPLPVPGPGGARGLLKALGAATNATSAGTVAGTPATSGSPWAAATAPGAASTTGTPAGGATTPGSPWAAATAPGTSAPSTTVPSTPAPSPPATGTSSAGSPAPPTVAH